MEVDVNSMLYWFPKLEKVEGLDLIETHMVAFTEKEIEFYYSDHDLDAPIDMEKYTDWVLKEIEHFGLPLFLRTDTSSAKHSWEKSCFINTKDRKKIQLHLFELVSFCQCAGIMGIPVNGFVARKYIPMKTVFTAFRGKMPVNPERRYFIKDGKVQCHHRYWLKDAFMREAEDGDLPDDWEKLADEANKESPEEVLFLTELSNEIAKEFEGYWSVDFCQGADGKWWCIDLALGENSWHDESCPHAVKPKEIFPKEESVWSIDDVTDEDFVKDDE